MFSLPKTISPISVSIFILRYLGLFPCVWKNSKKKNCFNFNDDNVYTCKKLAFSAEFLCYSSFVYMMCMFIYFDNFFTYFNVTAKENFSTLEISDFIVLIMLLTLTALNLTLIMIKIKQLKSFVNSNLTLILPRKIKIDFVFLISAFCIVSFFAENFIRKSIVILTNNSTEFPIYFKEEILIYIDTIIRASYVMVFYSIMCCLSNKWEFLRSSKFLDIEAKIDINLAIKISSSLVRIQNKCNVLFSNIISICLITNILSIIFYSFSLIVQASDYDYTFFKIQYTVLSLLLTILICDISDDINVKVSSEW